MKTEQTAIKPADLRVGSIINYRTPKGEIMTNVIDWQDLKWLTKDPEEFNLFHSPIPLTNDWLKKFGLNYLQNACWELGSMRIYNLSDEENSRFRITLAGNELVIINYVHQIQNLFHSLTQTELCLNDSI